MCMILMDLLTGDKSPQKGRSWLFQVNPDWGGIITILLLMEYLLPRKTNSLLLKLKRLEDKTFLLKWFLFRGHSFIFGGIPGYIQTYLESGIVAWNFFPEWIPNCLEFTPNHRAPNHELIETTQAYILWMVQKSPRPTTVWMFSKPMGCQLPFPQLVSWSRISGCHQQWLDRIIPTDFPGPNRFHPDLGGLVFMATWLGSLTSFTTTNRSWKGGGWIFSPRWKPRTNCRQFW